MGAGRVKGADGLCKATLDALAAQRLMHDGICNGRAHISHSASPLALAQSSKYCKIIDARGLKVGDFLRWADLNTGGRACGSLFWRSAWPLMSLTVLGKILQQD
jgi:hypothetical protein